MRRRSTCFNTVIPITVAHAVAIVAVVVIGTGHLASRSRLVVAIPTARLESFHVPLLSCNWATPFTATPAILHLYMYREKVCKQNTVASCSHLVLLKEGASSEPQ